MNKQEIINFIAEKNTPAPITWGDYKKLQVLELLLVCKATKIPADTETIALYTKMDESDIASAVKSLIADGTVTRTENPILENEILTLNIEGEGNEGQS